MMKRAITIGVLLLAMLALSWTALAQTGGGFDLSWFSVDGGGGTSGGGDFTLDGTIGQPDAGNELKGGAFAVTGGFQAGAAGITLTPGDCDGDGMVTSLDIRATFLERFDGDSQFTPYDQPPGTYPGTLGCDSNQDGKVTSLDIRCTFLIRFRQPCGSA